MLASVKGADDLTAAIICVGVGHIKVGHASSARLEIYHAPHGPLTARWGYPQRATPECPAMPPF